ncbi:hypothetical protein WICPIJ_007672 [Wickerhamomyces pijperi]|uniref:Uncharacterized protein n=1 Tax=Wickerhamomyces pijperi TaxID=599730 RepID=A0A9P8TJW0_WICPI|nr:hypothetical protein WICPIJ_007672 [Wickerhamomyces pijperi]
MQIIDVYEGMGIKTKTYPNDSISWSHYGSMSVTSTLTSTSSQVISASSPHPEHQKPLQDSNQASLSSK